MQNKSEPIEFPINVPVSLTLDVEPSRVKGKEKDGQWGKYNLYTYFALGNKIFWANDKLHDKLQSFKRGDIISITKGQAPGQRSFDWTVTVSGESPISETTTDLVTEFKALKRKVIELEQTLISYINGTRPKVTLEKTNEEIGQENKTEKFEDDLGF